MEEGNYSGSQPECISQQAEGENGGDGFTDSMISKKEGGRKARKRREAERSCLRFFEVQPHLVNERRGSRISTEDLNLQHCCFKKPQICFSPHKLTPQTADLLHTCAQAKFLFYSG